MKRSANHLPRTATSLASFLALCLLSLIGSGNALAVVMVGTADHLWAPVDRPEQLTIASWNTPIQSVPDPIVPPESESMPTSVSLFYPFSVDLVSELDDDYFGWLDLWVEGLSP